MSCSNSGQTSDHQSESQLLSSQHQISQHALSSGSQTANGATRMTMRAEDWGSSQTHTCTSVSKPSGLFSALFGPFPPVSFPLMYLCLHDSAPPSYNELTPFPAASLLMLAIIDSAIELCWSGRLTHGSKMDPSSWSSSSCCVKGPLAAGDGGRQRPPVASKSSAAQKRFPRREPSAASQLCLLLKISLRRKNLSLLSRADGEEWRQIMSRTTGVH